METLIQLSYFLAAVLFIVGLKAMSSPKTARKGVMWAGVGMVLAVVVTLFHGDIQGFSNYLLIFVAIAIGSSLAWVTAKRVQMTEMPQMVALYNGMGGGSAGAIGAVALMEAQRKLVESGDSVIHQQMGFDIAVLAVLGGLIGTVAFSGSLVAWAKLDGRMQRNSLMPAQQIVNIVLFAAMVLAGIWVLFSGGMTSIVVFFALALVFGVFMTVPIGGADMPVVISLFNALTGLAVGFKGFVLGNAALIIAGTLVGAAGMLLTHLMAKAMNRPISNVLFSGFGTQATGGDGPEGEMTEMGAEDAAYTMAYADSVVIVPGYGMAVGQAQHKIWEMVQGLQSRGVDVKFAIHPVAGRMPGHMNVLLAEAGVPYDMIYDMEEINEDFKLTDVVLVIGANDVVNPAAKTDESSPIYGMPILDVEDAEQVLVIKRGKGTGFSGVENHLFYGDKTKMVFGDAQKVASQMASTVKDL
ncbi:NAD(P)(+) transhydrogenase (Re/Si-specific) subunit beta [Aquisalimonas asiatica]|uniref:NAD(P) transhydrogenase subunit beta n=1 Tax=Aquisalimonas asiatica TaxID=406100 RepID=A0A1H8TE84_9GAMM|nr:NAD(P)(+) transhydrogenase (Re/Si-specific) subunit beta [Aquisalimonas asiatica]SEO88808.1 NAD(P) transhydrogenase subunit beta [Aquisalimonas asiatica]